MAIIRLEDKYKSKYKLQLTPERHYMSSSSGITGSVYVFPNRSETQKDNIDERLNLAPMAEEGNEFSGKAIRPYDSNSLEQRRIEIYKGEFNKLIGGAFSDAIQYEYKKTSGGNWSDGVAGSTSRTGEIANTLTYSTNDVVTRTSDSIIFEFDSNDQWVQGGLVSPAGMLYKHLPTSDRDRSALRYDVALGLLLDGANPFTEDHAWRQSGYSNSGNSSYTNASNDTQRRAYQFTGFTIFEDESGWPFLDAPLTNKASVNSWPPEALLPEVVGSITTNYVLKGYSDLSMHPRNATKKEVIRKRANYDIFSSGSMFQKIIANRMDTLQPFEEGWWTNNNQSLCLGSWSDSSGTKSPSIAYANTSNIYTINWETDKVTFEFWIKPCIEQTSVGTILQLDNCYSIALLPDSTSLKNGTYSKFKIGIYSQSLSDLSNRVPAITDTVTAASGGSGGIYVTDGVLNLDQWHHVSIRYGSTFNNGLLNIYVDSASVTPTDIDGQYDGVSRTTGIFDVSGTSYTAGDTLFVGGWAPDAGATALWGLYAAKQELQIDLNTTSYALGLAVTPLYQLKSELQELRVWNECRSEAALLVKKYHGMSSTTGMKLYIPFLFDPRNDTPQWNRVGFQPSKDDESKVENYYENGNFLKIDSTKLEFNKTQFCTNSAYIVGMPFINVHSHLREYVNSSYPVITNHYDLSLATATSPYPSVNSQLPADKKLSYFQNNWESLSWLRSINSMLIPSDNSKLIVDHSLLSDSMHKYFDASMLRLMGSGIASTASEYEISRFHDDEVFSIQDTIKALDPVKKSGFSGKSYGMLTSTLVAEGKLKDIDYITPLSTILSIPQIYYGNRVKPESIELKFQLNEEGKVITIKDFEGTLYRVDSINGTIKSKVGHIDYGNGIICIFSPLLTSIGQTNFDIKFKGERNLHVMQLDIPCPQGVANKSQNPSYKKLKASTNANESDKTITYISSIYLHDENLNIIGKVNLAQPIQKREEDSFIFRVKVDF